MMQMLCFIKCIDIYPTICIQKINMHRKMIQHLVFHIWINFNLSMDK